MKSSEGQTAGRITALASVAPAVNPGAKEPTMATYVLIHGAYQGGCIWQPVATRLRAAGHTVYAPTLDGCAERAHLVRAGITIETHATEIAQLLFFEDLRDVVLAGTSAGGMVIQKAAELARDR